MKKIVAYYPKQEIYSGYNSFDPSIINFDKITHLNLTLGTINLATNKLELLDDCEKDLTKLLSLSKKYPLVKILISVGGLFRFDNFKNIVLDQKKVKTFASSCVDFINTWNLDGIDINWNDDSSDIEDDYTSLLKELRESLDLASLKNQKEYLLTATVYEDTLNANTFLNYLDFININSFSEFENLQTSNYSVATRNILKDVLVTFKITNDWTSGYDFEIKIENNSASIISNWILTLDFDDTVNGIWNATSTIDNNHITINYPAWKPNLNPGDTFTIGGGATRTVENATPLNVKLNGFSIDGSDNGEDIPKTLGNVSFIVNGTDYGINTALIFNSVSYDNIKYGEELLVENVPTGTYTATVKTFEDSNYIYTGIVSPTSIIVSENATTIVNITYSKKEITTVPEVPGNYPDYSGIDVGVGRDFGDNFFSPFVDATLWFNNGLYPFGDEYSKSGAKFVNLGFIIANSSGQPSWGSYYDVSGKNPDTGHIIRNMFAQIKKLRSLGGDILVSFGGENGTPIHATIKSAAELAEHYIKFVNAFGLKNIDFDIEGQWTRDTVSWKRNNDAIKIMQDKLGENSPNVWYTFPTLPSGLVGKGTNNDAYGILFDAVSKGIKVRGVNIMTMCFGYSSVPNPSDMSIPVITSSESLKNQIKEIYAQNGVTLTDSDAYKMVGITPMIGVSYQSQEIFTLDSARKVLDYAKSKKIGQLSYWALTRDKTGNGTLSSGTQITQENYAFAKAWSVYNS